MDDLNDFVEALPHKLKIEVSLFIHEKTYKNVAFLKLQSPSFIAWICPYLKPFLCPANDYIYQEGDECKSIYFVKSGDIGFVLTPTHGSLKYINITVGEHFGIVDVVSSCLKQLDH